MDWALSSLLVCSNFRIPITMRYMKICLETIPANFYAKNLLNLNITAILLHQPPSFQDADPSILSNNSSLILC